MTSARLVLENVSIPDRAIRKWPSGATYVGAYTGVFDMDGVERTAAKLIWHDRNSRDLRLAWFDLESGEYLGEASK